MAEDLFSDGMGSTLDEPVWETIMRDVRLVSRRMLLVLMPGTTSQVLRAELRDWELWGPLFICMSLAILLSTEVAGEDASLVFSLIFFVVWVGSAVITVNAQLLGAKLSFFQTLCMLGYCVFPVLAGALLCLVFNRFLDAGLAIVLRFVAVVVGLLWSLMAASSFLADGGFPEGKKSLALYPVLLFYAGLSWMVLIGFQRGTNLLSSPTDSVPTQMAPPALVDNGTLAN
mmetsp:Transcript_10588/g.21326  ORF Transcript_10588/g.21326 Transcript_10588/m.21326 type:complete len:229 (-) Transcript_10588:1229-1915(-)